MKKNKISVIIPVYHNWKGLEKCLAALSRQTYPHENFEVLVINNDPTDYCKITFPLNNIKLIEENKKGSYAARNRGIKVSRYDILAFTDSDCIPSNTWLERGISSLTRETNTLIGGKIQLSYKYPKHFYVTELYEKLFAFSFQHEKNRSYQSAVTANIFVYKNAFTLCDGFDERLFSGGDTHLVETLRENGYKIIYDEKLIVNHPARNTISSLLDKEGRIFGGKVARLIYHKNTSRSWAILKSVRTPLRTKIYYTWSFSQLDYSAKIKITMIIITIQLYLFYQAMIILIIGKFRR